jgi:hypothetical protein
MDMTANNAMRLGYDATMANRLHPLMVRRAHEILIVQYWVHERFSAILDGS